MKGFWEWGGGPLAGGPWEGFFGRSWACRALEAYADLLAQEPWPSPRNPLEGGWSRKGEFEERV